MKRIPLFFVSFLIMFTSCTHKAEITTTLQYQTPYGTDPEYMHGKVKSVSEMDYWPIEKDGQIVAGNLISPEELDSIKLGNVFKAFYHENGEHKKTEYFAEDGIINHWDSELEGDKIAKTTWTWKDTACVYLKFEYDEQGHYKSAERYRVSTDTLIDSWIFTTNDDGCITISKHYNFQGELKHLYTANYNDQKLNEVQKAFSEKDSLLWESKYYYNEEGLSMKEEHYTSTGELRVSYENKYTSFDKMNNWLVDEVYKDGELLAIAKRTYEYY